MKTTSKLYHNFQDQYGNNYEFDCYLDFATWYFSQFRKTLVHYFSAETFKTLEKEATKSAEARKRI